MDFYTAVKNRRTNYTITDKCSVTDERLESILAELIKNTPSAFHSQSSRVVLLLADNHKKLWHMVMQTLKAIVPQAAFATTEAKINSFAAGYGTILYFEDQTIVQSLQESFPLYHDNFPNWSQQSSAMLQCNIWTALSMEGLGVSLQHYNPIIDEQVASEFDIPKSWKLIAQMPFGIAAEQPAPLDYKNLPERLRIIK